MPEGDTIHRAALNLQRWLAGRELTEVRVGGRVPVGVGRQVVALAGDVVERVEAQGKHLLMRLASGRVLHTHMRMTGSWHVYPAGERWRKPAWQATVTLVCGDRVAVCFNAPVVEVIEGAAAEAAHGSLSGLGPDLLVPPVDFDVVLRRARRIMAGAPKTEVGELLLDQRVAAGIGNIYRCESLFLEGVGPRTPVGSVPEERVRALYETASRLLLANVGGRDDGSRGFGVPGSPTGVWVYGRTGRPCRRCGSTVQAARTGKQARTAYWCPSCQPAG